MSNPDQKPNRDNEYKILKQNQKSIHFPFDFDRWYYLFEDLMTEECNIIPIASTEAKAFVNFYKVYCLNKYNSTDITNDYNAVLCNITSLIQYKLNTRINKNVFVRMSNRSPKDGISLNIKQNINNINNSDYSEIQANDALIKICDMQIKNLKCNNAHQIMNLLLTSERIFTDLLLAIECNNYADNIWSTSIILREFNDNIEQGLEFRLFVYNGKITAISQYNHYCYYHQLNQTDFLNEIIAKMINFTQNNIIPIIQDKSSNFVIDLAIVSYPTKKLDDLSCIKIIEFNPFHETTGPCLFSWNIDHDILFNISPHSHPVVRIVTGVPQNINQIVDMVTLEDKLFNSSTTLRSLHDKTVSCYDIYSKN